jgi:hypothetical protein
VLKLKNNSGAKRLNPGAAQMEFLIDKVLMGQISP